MIDTHRVSDGDIDCPKRRDYVAPDECADCPSNISEDHLSIVCAWGEIEEEELADRFVREQERKRQRSFLD